MNTRLLEQPTRLIRENATEEFFGRRIDTRNEREARFICLDCGHMFMSEPPKLNMV